MACVRKKVSNKILGILDHGKKEDVVVAIALFEKWRKIERCQACNTLKEEKLISKIWDHLPSSLLAEMIRNKGSAGLPELALSFLACTGLSDKGKIAVYEECLPYFVDYWLTNVTMQQRYQIQITLKCLAGQVAPESQLPLLETIFSHPTLSQPTQPIEILQTVTDICSLPTDCKVSLSNNSAVRLQAMIVQCLHGLAPEELRDSTLNICSELLSAVSFLNPNWSIASSQYSTSNISNVDFPSFLCSIVAGEVRLTIEEAVHCLQLPSLDSKEAPRLNRSLQTLSNCVDLLDSMIHLLVGDEDGMAPWAELGVESIERIRHHLNICYAESLEFLVDIATLYKEKRVIKQLMNDKERLLMPASVLEKIVALVINLANEDDELRAKLLPKLPTLFDIYLLVGEFESFDKLILNMIAITIGSMKVWSDEEVIVNVDDLAPTFQPCLLLFLQNYHILMKRMNQAGGDHSTILGNVKAMTLSADYILPLLVRNGSALRTLVIAEGVAAFKSVFQCEIRILEEFYRVLINMKNANFSLFEDLQSTLLKLLEYLHSYFET